MNMPHSAHTPSRFDAWLEATRPRTLPVSVAGVIAGTGCAIHAGGFRPLPALICLAFAVIAQIASNFANEYYDYARGLDRKGREGFRRGVTEGDIRPGAMLRATYALILLDGLLGSVLMLYGGGWLLLPGIAIAVFAVAYSAGPYPLSHHGLGDLAVVIFFGLVPVSLTCYVQTGVWSWTSPSLAAGLAVGLMAANVLVVNNYRDADDDRAVGKRTTVVIFGRRAMSLLYLAAGLAAPLIPLAATGGKARMALLLPTLLYMLATLRNWLDLRRSSGARLNPLLGRTALNLLVYAILFTLCLSLIPPQ